MPGAGTRPFHVAQRPLSRLFYVCIAALCCGASHLVEPAAAAVLNPPDGAVFVDHPPALFSWSVGPNETFCEVGGLFTGGASPWQQPVVDQYGESWQLQINDDSSSATVDTSLSPLVWGEYTWGITADTPDTAALCAGGATATFTYGPLLDVAEVGTQRGAWTRLRIASVTLTSARLTGIVDKGADATPIALKPSSYAAAIRTAIVTVPWSCADGGIQEVRILGSDGATADASVGDSCDGRFTFDFGTSLEGQPLDVSVSDAWEDSSLLEPGASVLVPYRLCIGGPTDQSCRSGEYDLGLGAPRLIFGRARPGGYRVSLYVNNSLVARRTFHIARRAAPHSGGYGLVTTSGVGPRVNGSQVLQFATDDQSDVRAFAGSPTHTSFLRGPSVNFQAPEEVWTYRRRVGGSTSYTFVWGSDGWSLEGFYTTSRKFSTPGGTRVGMSFTEAARREGVRPARGCLTGLWHRSAHPRGALGVDINAISKKVAALSAYGPHPPVIC